MTETLGTYILRFDLRAPAFGAPVADLYATALDMAAWSEEHGFTAVVVSEHHATDDGYLPVAAGHGVGDRGAHEADRDQCRRAAGSRCTSR